ncbi:MAG TPA: glycosyltransferase family 2 protein [Puia sp.]|nr:glycosyltransferase family 2 protein [Puia sp.]
MPSVKPLITIITPTYNAGNFIEKCIESVQAQTFGNFEHLILDGISGDDTVKRIQSLQQGDARIRLEIEKDNGVYDAMNKGISLASGDWLYFLGADDYLYEQDSLKRISEFLIGNENQIIYGNVFFENLHRLYDDEFDIEKILTHNISHQAVFYHVSVFRTLSSYDLRYRTEADYDLNLKCWLGGRIRHQFVPVTIAYYSGGGLSSTQQDEPFTRDYPANTIDYVLKGKWKLTSKIHFLSIIYRKIFQRGHYGARVFAGNFFRTDHFLYRIFAFIWMCLSSPFYLFRKKAK